MDEKIKPILKEAHSLLILPNIADKPDNFSVYQRMPGFYKNINLLIDSLHNKPDGTSKFKTLKTIRRELHFNLNEKLKSPNK